MMDPWYQREILKALLQLEAAFTSHVDGRDLLEQLRPNHWHHCDIHVRINGQTVHYEGDWLKRVARARSRIRTLMASLDWDSVLDEPPPQTAPVIAGRLDDGESDAAEGGQ